MLYFVIRYQLYGQWKSQSYYTQPELIAARMDTMKRAKYIFSRLTKENVKQQGRLIGKLSHANPTVFFEYVSATPSEFPFCRYAFSTRKFYLVHQLYLIVP